MIRPRFFAADSPESSPSSLHSVASFPSCRTPVSVEDEAAAVVVERLPERATGIGKCLTNVS